MAWRLHRWRLLLAGITWLAFLGGASVAAATDNIAYNGGPVAHSMTGVVVDWGPNINSMYTNETSGDPGLIKYLGSQSGSTGDIGGVLAQYMDSSGHNAANQVSYGQQFEITPSMTSSTVYDSQIQSELSSQIAAGHLPHPAGNGLSTIYLVLFPNGDVECTDAQDCSANAPDQSTAVFCAYHASMQLPDGTKLLYAVLPDNTSGPMSYECGQAPTRFDDQTSFLSHEWAETISDPLGNAWWVSNSSSSDYGNEVGDNCNQFMGPNGPWTVQLEWSNLDANCVGSESAYSAPTASFLAPGAAGPGQQVSFDASSSSDPSADRTAITGTSYSIGSGIASYRWSWGDGSSSAASTPTASHTYAATGNYQVSLTVTDQLGFSSTVTHSLAITANGTLPPSATTGGGAGVSDTGATFEGSVNSENQTVQYQFSYGTSAGALTHSTPLTAGPSGQTATPVSATVSGLAASTTYYYRLDVIYGGQTYSGTVQSFTTTATPSASQTPIVATGSASPVGPQGAILSGTVNPGGSQVVSYRFAYGTSAGSLSSSTAPSAGASGTSALPVSASLSGLASNTMYYFRLDVNAGGQTYSGTVHSFTTSRPVPGAVTGAAGSVSSTGATVSGTVLPAGLPTTYLVEFGPTTAYGHSTPSQLGGSGTGPTAVRVTLAGLRPRTLYHYRLVAMSAGGTSVGADRTFTTTPALGQAPRFSFAVASRAALRMALDGRLRVHFRCSRGCVARFTVTVASARLARFTPVAITLGRGSGRVSHGWGSASLRFGPVLRRRLRRQRTLRLVVVGYAVSSGSTRTAPRAVRLTLG